MSNDFVIRASVQSDIESLPDIERRAGRLFPPERLPDPDPIWKPDDLLVASQQNLLFVAEIADRVVGFAVAEVLPPNLHLAEVAVDPDAARRGIGRALVMRVVEEAQQRGLAGTSLTTFSDFPWNGPFYTRLGFQTIAQADLTPELAQILNEERSMGMIRRIAMLKQP
ncbi:MAG: GNAT family N-acetyltransferase [Proteobacteria bacterium]|nr:GNAT family N-acetyltransferase [Pseudomonadota bacterium]